MGSEVKHVGSYAPDESGDFYIGEARRMPGLSGAILEVANEARSMRYERLVQEAVDDANHMPTLGLYGRNRTNRVFDRELDIDDYMG